MRARCQPHLTPFGAGWSAPYTVLGLICALLSGAVPRREGGLLVAESGRGFARLFLARRGFGAVTFGRVVITLTPLAAEARRHEEHHAWQYGRLGPLFLPLYLWHHLRSGYSANPLEREAQACGRGQEEAG